MEWLRGQGQGKRWKGDKREGRDNLTEPNLNLEAVQFRGNTDVKAVSYFIKARLADLSRPSYLLPVQSAGARPFGGLGFITLVQVKVFLR